MSTDKPADGDTIRITDVITDVIEGVVTHVGEAADGTVTVRVEGSTLARRLVAAPYMGTRTGVARTWEVTKKTPDPWQAGDIAHHERYGTTMVRQADGSWMRHDGTTDCLGDDYADGNYTPIVRGGKLVAE